jgi:hypothetical protein
VYRGEGPTVKGCGSIHLVINSKAFDLEAFARVKNLCYSFHVMVKPGGSPSKKLNVSPFVFWLVSGILVFAVLFASYFISNHSVEIYSLEVTNISPTSATVVWRTQRPTIGTVRLGGSDTVVDIVSDTVSAISGTEVFWDTRDVRETDDGSYTKGTLDSYNTHHVTIYGLEPEKTYTFSILNNYVPAVQSETFTFKTPDALDTLQEPNPVYGILESDGGFDLDDTVVIAQVYDATTLDVDRYRSQYVSTVVHKGSYIIDVGNLYDSSLEERFPGFEDEETVYDLRLLVLTPKGFVQHEVDKDRIHPVDTISVSVDELQESFIQRLIPDVMAKCDSECVGDCQGCNLDTPGDPNCATYGCGYMSWCCGYGDDECANHCTNGKEDCGELGVDCGGGCKSCSTSHNSDECPSDKPCKSESTGECVPRSPVTGTCGCAIDGRITTEAGETGRNCGGHYCPACSNAGSHCFNRVLDAEYEEGVDCGGDCAASCAKPGVSANIGTTCSNEGEVFTCKDRPDWNCWCRNGKVEPYHTKSSVVHATPSASGIVQEGTTPFWANSKFGIHTGWGPGSDYGSLLQGGNVGYVMNVIGDPGQYAALLAEYKNLPPGVVPIVRFCDATNVESCAFKDVGLAAEFINNLSAELGKPVAVISGPNEPLQEPWTLPGGCAQEDCVGQVNEVAKATAEWMNQFLQQTGSSGNLIHLSPDLNTSEANFEQFVNAMKANDANFAALDGVAANAYEGAGGKSINDVIEQLKKMGFSNIFITEAGVDPNKISSDPQNYQALYDQLQAIAEDPAVMSMLLFNPLPGLNPDGHFDKHELTMEQYQGVVNALSETTVQTTSVTAADGGTEVIQAPVVTGTGAYTCGRGRLVQKGSSYCCVGDGEGDIPPLNICVDSAGNAYLEGTNDHKDASWGVDKKPDAYIGTAILDGKAELGKMQSFACAYIHTYGSESTTAEHEEQFCIIRSGSGANVGVGGGQGKIQIPSLVQKAYAAEEGTVDPGIYDVSSTSVDITTQTVQVIRPGLIMYFYDLDEDGVHDDNEPYLTDSEAQALEIVLNKSIDIVTYDLEYGWNSMAFPMLMHGTDTSDVSNASDLLSYLRVSGIDATNVAAYRGQQFMMYSERVDTEGTLKAFGTDFGLVPGEGYFIKVNKSGSIVLSGNFVSGSLDAPLYTGWNLVGFYKEGSNSLRAFDLLEGMQAENIPADTITKREYGRYSSFVLDDGTAYGTDFLVFPSEGYWVRVAHDRGFESGFYSP